jgi:hypothetical protein
MPHLESTQLETPQTACLAAVARADITPPVGIYHRMWGAARHDQATGVHRPLTATLLWLAPRSADPSQALLIAAIDHCILDAPDVQLFQQAVADAVQVRPAQLQVALSHTHGSGLMSRSRFDQPGGEMIGPYLDGIAATLANLARQARDSLKPATIVYGTGRCNLAAERDFFDSETKQYVCGFNPAGIADDTVLVARVVEHAASALSSATSTQAARSTTLATLVNYACHPTTLAWDNTAISPDYVGALRETVEQHTGAPCLFLQGASGDLGPHEGFVGDWEVADRNGRQLAYASLSALEALPPAGTSYRYQGPVISGTRIGVWKHEPSQSSMSETWQVERLTADLPYRADLPDFEATQRELGEWKSKEQAALAADDRNQARDCRAKAEQMTRQLWRLQSVPRGKCFPLTVTLARLGGALWLFAPGEHYQVLQTTLRQRFPNVPWVIATITNGWQPGYIPPANKFGYGIYQEEIALVGPGAAELLIEAISRAVKT